MVISELDTEAGILKGYQPPPSLPSQTGKQQNRQWTERNGMGQEKQKGRARYRTAPSQSRLTDSETLKVEQIYEAGGTRVPRRRGTKIKVILAEGLRTGRCVY